MKADGTLVNVQGQEECYSWPSSSVGITLERPSFQFLQTAHPPSGYCYFLPSMRTPAKSGFAH